MVIDWATMVATVSGAFISGIIGILYSEYRTRRERNEHLKEWYNQLINLANRTHRVASDEFDAEPSYIRNSIAGNLGKLSSHILNAPENVDEGVILEAEKLAEECQRIQSVNDPTDSMITFIGQDRFLEQAKIVAEECKSAKNDVGWL